MDEELENLANNLEKSTNSPEEILKATIQKLGPVGLKEKLSTLSKSQGELLKGVLEDMKKAAVTMDDAYQAEYVKRPITETVIQEDKADDDQDEKLVKPEATKHPHQGGSGAEGEAPWEGQIIKAKKSDETKEKKTAKKMTDAVDEMAEQEAKEAVEDHNKKLHPESVKKSEDEIMNEELKTKIAELKKSVEEEMGDSATPELVKAQVKAMLAEESQSDDKLDELQKKPTRTKKQELEDQVDNDDANKMAQDKVDDTKQGGLKKSVVWNDEDALLKANTNGRNFHFGVNEYYGKVSKAYVEAEEKSKEGQELAKSMKTEEEKELDTNDLIAKGLDFDGASLDEANDMEANKTKVNGRLVKSFSDDEIAASLGLTEEEKKQILGE